MKIVQINATYGVGSTGKIVRDISEMLIEDGHESYVMWATSCRAEKKDVNLIRIGGFLDHKLHALLYRLFGGQGSYSRLATKSACRKIEAIKPDVVHLHNLHSNYINLPSLLRFLAERDIPTLITLHDCWFFSGQCCHYLNHACLGWQKECSDCPAVGKRLRKKVKKTLAERRALYESFDKLTVNGVSKWTAEVAGASVLKSASAIDYIYNWIDTDVYKPCGNPSEIRNKYGIPADKKIILGVSQLWSEKKGLSTFVSLAEKLSDVATVVLVGECNDSALAEKGIKCVGFTSSREELAELYSAADVLVNASTVETFGLVTVEAMACGTPVVAYDNTGSSEIVEDGCGILVPDGDFNAMISAVRAVLDNGKETYSAACRNCVVENFAKDSQVDKYINLYQEMMAK